MKTPMSPTLRVRGVCAIISAVIAVAALPAGAKGPIEVDLGSPHPVLPVMRVFGDDPQDQLGQFYSWSPIAIGDINGDGLADIIVGAPNAGGALGIPSLGETYVIYGGPNLPRSTVNLNTDGGITPAKETRIVCDPVSVGIEGHSELIRTLGSTVAAGDLDGDGTSDLIFSAEFASPRAEPEARFWGGTIHVLYGHATLPGCLLKIDPDAGKPQFGETRIFGHENYKRLGFLAMTVCDFDGDGFDDLVSQNSYGWVYILYGGKELRRGEIVDLNAKPPPHGGLSFLGSTHSRTMCHTPWPQETWMETDTTIS